MFKNIISLGFYCEVAKELERLGLRSASYPFDWLISSWYGVEKMLDTNFDGFLNYEDLHQYDDSPSKYRNMNTGISFFHDFNPFQPLKDQMDEVEKKYKRRIERFFKDIKNPTLFIRYIESTEEVEFWKNNYFYVQQKLKMYNEQNTIWLINCLDSSFENENVFFVEPDENDYLCRYCFLEKMPKLKEKLVSDEIFSTAKRKENLKRYEKKKIKEKSFASKVKRKLEEIKDNHTPQEKYYNHNNIYHK